MTIQCMRWEIGCEAYYYNLLDFRQLHKSRHHKMSQDQSTITSAVHPSAKADHCGKHWLPTRRGRWGGTNLHRPDALVCIQKQPLCRLYDHPSPQALSMANSFVDVLWWHNLVCFSYINTNCSEGNNNDGNNNTSDGNNNNNCEGNSNREWQYLAYVMPGHAGRVLGKNSTPIRLQSTVSLK